MASGWYIQGLVDIGNGLIDLDNDTLAVMLVDENYTYDPDHDVVDNGGNDATDPSFNELQGVTNYVDGFGGGGRKMPVLTGTKDAGNNRAKWDLTNITWTAIGGGGEGNVSAAILIKEITNDAASRLIAFFDLTTTPVNGGDLTADYDANDGDLRLDA